LTWRVEARLWLDLRETCHGRLRPDSRSGVPRAGLTAFRVWGEQERFDAQGGFYHDGDAFADNRVCPKLGSPGGGLGVVSSVTKHTLQQPWCKTPVRTRNGVLAVATHSWGVRWQARVKLLQEKKLAYLEKRKQVLHRPPPTMDQRIAQQIRREQAAEAHASPSSESKCAASRLPRLPPRPAQPLSHPTRAYGRCRAGGGKQARETLDRYLATHRVEHVVPHVLSASSTVMKLSQGAPARNPHAPVSSSQADFQYQPPDLDVYAERQHFRSKVTARFSFPCDSSRLFHPVLLHPSRQPASGGLAACTADHVRPGG